MPAELAWTRELPTKPGLYVMRRASVRHALSWALDIFVGDEGLLQYQSGNSYFERRPLVELEPDAEWLGPLPE